MSQGRVNDMTITEQWKELESEVEDPRRRRRRSSAAIDNES